MQVKRSSFEKVFVSIVSASLQTGSGIVTEFYIRVVVSFGVLQLSSNGKGHVILEQNMDADTKFMQEALTEAREAAAAGEVPIGAVLVRDERVLVRAGNRTIRDCDPTAHAEIVVLREAARILGNYRLTDTTLYVTIEPCSMCAGAMIQARVARLVYGADEPRGGAVRSCFEVLSHRELNHRVEVTSGILASDCSEVIQSFFAIRRQ